MSSATDKGTVGETGSSEEEVCEEEVIDATVPDEEQEPVPLVDPWVTDIAWKTRGNSPGKRSAKSKVWERVKRLAEDHPNYNRKIESAATSEADNEEELVSSEDNAVPYCKKQKVADKSSRLRNSSEVSCGVPYSDTGHLSHLFAGGLSSSEEEEEEEDKDAPTESELIKQDRADAVLEFDKVIKNG
eukprot:scaffold378769_cov64-Attheya_sp.AAC.1